MAPRRPDRRVLALTGAIPGIAISAGLLSLDDGSALKAQYWPWLPLVVLALGLGFSAFFWLVLARRRDDKDRN